MAVVVDTGPLVAAANRRDDAHEFAATLLELAGHDLLVPDPVVAECDSFLRGKRQPESARRLLAALAAGSYVRVSLSASAFADAVAIDRHYADLGLGLADAAVMAVAASTHSPILTFDFRDFRAAPPLLGGSWELVVDEAQYARAIRPR